MQIPNSKAEEIIKSLEFLEGFLIGARVPEDAKVVRKQTLYLQGKLEEK